MSPRQIDAALHFDRRARRAEKADQLAIAILGARGKAEDIKRQHDEWTKE